MLSESWLRTVERHLSQASPLIQELCLLPGSEGASCRAVVVPNPGELSAQKVPLARARVREVLSAAAVSSPHPMEIDEFVLWDSPLLRSPEGEPDRHGIAARVEEEWAGVGHPSASAPVDEPAAQRLLDRLEAVLEVPGPFAPSQRLERDLGVDSLSLVQLRLVLEQEFGAPLADEDLWRIRTVGDVLERVAAVTNPPVDPQPVDTTWSARLREAAAAPLGERFNLDRRGVNFVAARAGMLSLALAARLAFRTELVNPERLPAEGPFLFCPSHQSFLDSVLIYAVFPKDLVERMAFVAFGPYFHSAPASWLVRMGRLILTGEGDSVADSLRLAYEALGRDMPVCIFPEGARSYTGDVMRARPGVGILACEAQVPIVPILYDGTEGTYSPQQPGFRPVKIRVVVGEPITPPPVKAFGRADYQAMADRWQAAVIEMVKESKRGRAGGA